MKKTKSELSRLCDTVPNSSVALEHGIGHSDMELPVNNDFSNHLGRVGVQAGTFKNDGLMNLYITGANHAEDEKKSKLTQP
jgi:hypothetical protein